MRNSLRLSFLAGLYLLALAACTASIGCVPLGRVDPTVQLTMAGDVLATSEAVLASAERSGLIPVAEAPKIKSAVLAARALYITAAVHLNDSKFSAVIAELQTALNQVVTLRAAYAAPVPPS